MTLSEVNEISGEKGNFSVSITQFPRYVDMSKCIACGLCTEKCPAKVDNEYEGGLVKRKAIYVKYAQAVPLKYAIDDRYCLKLLKGKCGLCEKKCPTGAINYKDKKKSRSLKVGAIVLAQGTKAFDPATNDTYGYAKNPDIVTSLEFERILSASGPYGGHLVRPSNHEEPKKIAWIQCVGSRDEHLGDKGYCSAVCCTYAVKEAMLAKEHSKSFLDTAVFYIDVRTFGKDFERYYNRAKDEHGVRFVKTKLATVDKTSDNKPLLRYVDDTGARQEETFDIVVLSVGLTTTTEGRELAAKLGVGLDRYGFAATNSFSPVETDQPGIFVCGAFAAPKDIPSSVIDSSAAAGVAGNLLAPARKTLTRTVEIPSQTDVRGEANRIGVFLCCCGTNIAGVVDMEKLLEYTKSLPDVAFVEKNLFSCSQDSQDKMAKVIAEQKLNRIVVAACTPKTHEPLFQETLTNAGLNKYLFEMVNIRNQDSWVHKDVPDKATEKAKDLVRMSVAKAALLQPLSEPVLTIDQNALVIGGGVAGMEAARMLATQGFKTYIVERSAQLGGQALSLARTWRGEDIQAYLKKLIADVSSNSLIEIFTGASLTGVDGFVGNFKTTISKDGKAQTLVHGVTIVACGATELVPDMYEYGADKRIVTGLELEKRMALDPDSLSGVSSAVFVQCVGSRIPERPYCSKVCCTQSIKNALALKKKNPARKVFVLYRDMRPYGLREELYREARMAGVVFVRYNFDKPFEVAHSNKGVTVSFTDSILNRKMAVTSDLLVLASAITPEKENPLAQLYKVSQNADGFFAEAHVKLRPVDFATDGVFVCGLAHAPKSIDESITQAQAAAARAVTLLSRETIAVPGTVAQVDTPWCSSCGVCVSICPYGAPKFDEKSGKAQIEASLCKGCGLCVASCRSGAIHLNGFDGNQILAMVEMVMD